MQSFGHTKIRDLIILVIKTVSRKIAIEMFKIGIINMMDGFEFVVKFKQLKYWQSIVDFQKMRNNNNHGFL